MPDADAGSLPHLPVLLSETVDSLELKPGDHVIDCTVGAGGHAAAVLERTAPSGRLLGFDLDEVALEAARKRLDPYGSRAMLVRANYREVESVVQEHHFGPTQAAVLDLGYSSMEIDDPSRGFSFRADGPLDMRFDQRQTLTAKDLVNSLDADKIALILAKYGEERFARRIAERIVSARAEFTLETTDQLVDVIAAAVPAYYRRGKLHFATRTFQALRLAVNDELTNIETALPKLLSVLRPGGRLAVISFHSLEDRIVKRYFRDAAQRGELEVITKRPLTASLDEIKDNPRSRSAKLRVAQKAS
jgi:16S rRNA (cytosine1402-N4)-methyltransferase